MKTLLEMKYTFEERFNQLDKAIQHQNIDCTDSQRRIKTNAPLEGRQAQHVLVQPPRENAVESLSHVVEKWKCHGPPNYGMVIAGQPNANKHQCTPSY